MYECMYVCVYVCMCICMCVCMYLCACVCAWILYSDVEERISDAYLHHIRAHVCIHECTRAYPRRSVRALSVGVDRVRFGPQAFASATAFNANIGAWNTASVTDLSSVCAAWFRHMHT